MRLARCWSPGTIATALTAASLLLWAHSILYARLEIGYFGLIHGLPVTYFIALAFLTSAAAVLWMSKGSHGRLLCLQLVILISALWLVPVVTGGTTPFTDHAYRNLTMSDLIVSQSHFATTGYFRWPGVFVLSASLTTIGTLNFESILNFIPFFMQLLSLLPLYVFLRNTLGQSRRNYWWAGAWLFFLARWVGDSHLTPVSLAYFLLLTVLALMTTYSIARVPSRKFALLPLIVVTFAALAVTHLPTSIAALSILGLFSLAKRNRALVSTAVLCLALLVTWDVLVTGYMTGRLGIDLPFLQGASGVGAPAASAIPGVVNLNVGEVFEREVLSFVGGSESHATMVWIKIAFSAMFAAVGLIGAVFACRTRAGLAAAAPLLALTAAPMLLFLFSGYYDSLLAARVYLYSLPAMAYFGARLLDIRKRATAIILCLLMIAAVPLHIVANYGNEAQEYYPPGLTAGVHFTRDKFGQDFDALSAFPMGRRYTHERLQQMERNDAYLPSLLWLTSQDKAWYIDILAAPELLDEHRQSLASNTNYAFVYNNPDFSLYLRVPGRK